jgi:pimeloyl-ACP methyl ester carboxylesterase
VRDYPDLFHAFVSSGQMVNTTENDVMGYEFALEYLTERGDMDTVETLRSNGPPPYTEGNLVFTYAAYLGVLNDYMALHAHGEGKDADILIDAINEPEYGLVDKVNWLRGLMNTFNVVYPQLEDLDFATQAAELEVPVHFFVGRYDVNAMASLVERYYDVLDAPYKELIWFEKSGHPPLYSEASKVVDVMVNRVMQYR